MMSIRAASVSLTGLAALLLAACAAESQPATAVSDTAPSSTIASNRAAEPLTDAAPAASTDVAAASNDAGPSEPTISDVPSGALALFFRTSFSSDTERLRVSGGDITWETGSKGIVRYIPETGRYDVMKTISSPSWAPSSIYPLTVDGRLFSIRDWRSDWTSRDKHFTIEELDPVSGRTLSTTNIYAEWFTFSEDRLFYKSEVKTDLFGRPSGGGRLMVKTLGSPAEQTLAEETERIRAIGDTLLAISGTQVHRYSPQGLDVEIVGAIDESLLENIWPYAQKVFAGDGGIYWAVETVPGEVDVVSLSADGSMSRLFSIELDADEVDLVIDEHDGLVMVGAISSAPPRGLAVTQIFTVDPAAGESEEIVTDQHIPSAQAEAGGGLQMLRLP